MVLVAQGVGFAEVGELVWHVEDFGVAELRQTSDGRPLSALAVASQS